MRARKGTVFSGVVSRQLRHFLPAAPGTVSGMATGDRAFFFFEYMGNPQRPSCPSNLKIKVDKTMSARRDDTRTAAKILKENWEFSKRFVHTTGRQQAVTKRLDEESP